MVFVMRDKIGISALKDIGVLYKGDVYDLACLLLKVYDAKNMGKNTRSRHTVHGLATSYSMLVDVSYDKIIEVFESYSLPLGAAVEYDDDLD